MALKIPVHRQAELSQKKLFEIPDAVLLIEKNDSLLVFNFIHATVGKRAEIISKQNRIPKDTGCALVSIFKRLDVGDHQNSNQGFFKRTFRLIDEHGQLFQNIPDLKRTNGTSSA